MALPSSNTQTGWDEIDSHGTGAERLQKEVANQQLEHASLYRQCFATDAGRYVLNDLIENFFKQRIVRPDDTQFAAAIRQGQHDVVDRILVLIDFANKGGGIPTGPGAQT